ncbi:MAG TPA: hypothetical protein PLJ47_16750 [Candidatus Hydrogenedentes bacterium]|nr:hypothetical protein [Candidatus Hydrogenedentota bacterium]
MQQDIRIGVWLIVAFCAAFVATAQRVNEFPKPDDPLPVRVEMSDALMRGNHINEGIFMQHVVFPPAGLDRPIVGSQEDAIEITGAMMAAYCYRYAVTKDPEHRRQCHEILDGIEKLEKVTGVPGVFARSFNKTDKPLWHERAHFFPIEWHESTTMPGYRWQGDLSSDKFVDLCYMLGVYYDLAADDKHKPRVAGILDRLVGRVVDYNFKLVDVDNKMTLWGNFCPDIPHQPLNSLEMLAALKTAHRITGKDRYRAAYRMLIDKYHYDDEAIMAKTIWPDEWNVIHDDKLACKSYWQLIPYETDPTLANKYRMALNRHQYAWSLKPNLHNIGALWFPMVYTALTGEDVLTPETKEAIKNMQGIRRTKSVFRIPNEDGTVREVESEEENHAALLLMNYWFGRYHNMIDPSW